MGSYIHLAPLAPPHSYMIEDNVRAGSKGDILISMIYSQLVRFKIAPRELSMHKLVGQK